MKKQRILDLIEQAELRKPHGISGQENDDEYGASIEDLERFAELIIQECSAQLDANRLAVFDANHHHEYWNCGVKWAVAKLKNHFTGKMKYVDCNTI
jgi:2,4-dienoyl-CoA reductase-like NADH-dependent reductase (Old Yellow Enzyme family)